MQRRIPAFRRARARKQAIAGTAVLATVLGLSFAQMAPARGWPSRNFWTVGLFDEGGGTVYCAMHASNATSNKASTLSFALVQGSIGWGAVIRADRNHAIDAHEISFASDGFHVITAPAKSFFSRTLTGAMDNAAASRLDPDQWEKLGRFFRNSGVVTVDTAFIEARMPTQGFERASADFEQCLAQLDLVAR
jgi:hypothetical protein